MILTFLICLPPSDPGLPETKWNSMSGWSRLLLVNLVDTQARPWNDSELLNIFVLIVNFILMGILNYEGIVFPAAELAIIKSCNKTILMPPNVSTLSWSISAAFGECNDAKSQGTVVMNQCRVRCGPPHEACHRHNSDLRDFHVYIQTQVWRERILTRQCSMRFDKKTRQY